MNNDKQQMSVDEINELTEFICGGAKMELAEIRRDLDRYRRDINFHRTHLMVQQVLMVEGIGE